MPGPWRGAAPRKTLSTLGSRVLCADQKDDTVSGRVEEKVRSRDQRALAGRWMSARRFHRGLRRRARAMLLVVAVLSVFCGPDGGVNSFPLRCRNVVVILIYIYGREVAVAQSGKIPKNLKIKPA